MLVQHEAEVERVSRLEAERNQSEGSPLPWAQAPPGTPQVAPAWAWGWWSPLCTADDSHNLPPPQGRFPPGICYWGRMDGVDVCHPRMMLVLARVAEQPLKPGQTHPGAAGSEVSSITARRCCSQGTGRRGGRDMELMRWSGGRQPGEQESGVHCGGKRQPLAP